jgi:hypothetical protein
MTNLLSGVLTVRINSEELHRPRFTELRKFSGPPGKSPEKTQGTIAEHRGTTFA